MVLKFLALALGCASAAHVPLRGAAGELGPHSLGASEQQQQHARTQRSDLRSRNLPVAAAAPAAAEEVCLEALEWESAGGRVLLNGEPFQIKGISWFGFETETNVVQGLWGGANTMNTVLGAMRALGVNALRIPVSLDLALAPLTRVQVADCVECAGALAWDVLDLLFDKAAAYGMLIMLDMHRLNRLAQTGLWYDALHTEADFKQGWVNLLTRFGQKPNLFAIDLKNEPSGLATWGQGVIATDWNLAAQRIVAEITTQLPDFNRLIFVEGVATTDKCPTQYPFPDPSFDKFLGQNLDGVATVPIDFGDPALNKLLVYSPHVYGPDVLIQPYFKDPTFPANMAQIWDKQMGFLKQATGNAVVIGEWGGTLAGKDLQWAVAFTDYMVANCFNDNFYWSINPNSGDVGGLFAADWKTPINAKIALMRKAQPTPSAFTTAITDAGACLTYGAPVCAAAAATNPPVVVPPPAPEVPPAPGVPQQPGAQAPPPKLDANGCALEYAQCAGVGFGKFCCTKGTQCVQTGGIYYSQCQPLAA